MNKNAIQKYAIWARNELIEQIKQRAYQYGISDKGYGDENATVISGRVLSPEENRQRREFVEQIRKHGFEQAVEEVAYTWFNRFVALRFMEVNDYLPTHVRVFSDASGNFNPEILKDVLHLDLPGLDKAKVSELLNANKTEELYRYLLLTQCNALNVALPEMFEKLGSYTEMLLPNNILKSDGVLGRLVTDIPEEDWRDAVQIIGWMYQYYNSEPKQAVFNGLKKNIKITKEKIPAATQLFTPDWIVRYMVENSLGKLYISCKLRDSIFKSETEHIAKEKEIADKFGWRYYIPEAEQTPEVRAALEAHNSQLATTFSIEDIKILDPCMGSGHILVYAFDVLMQIYESEGYNPRDAAKLILEKNIYGLDIDRRAYQLAYFALIMKARQYNRRIFTEDVKPQVYHPVGWSEGEEFGSLIKVDTLPPKPELPKDQISIFDDYERDLRIWHFKRLLAQKYDVVVTNPPYAGANGLSGKISGFLKSEYPNSKSDLFSAFIERCIGFKEKASYIAMITQQAWMFLTSYEKLRGDIRKNATIVSMVHLGQGSFGMADFGLTAFVLCTSSIKKYKGTYTRLIADSNPEWKETSFLSGKYRYIADSNSFSMIPGNPIVYWASESLLRAFTVGTPLYKIAEPRVGMQTGDNNRFIKLWWELNRKKIITNAKSEKDFILSGCKYVPYNKGGEKRQWYGNYDYVVNWENNGEEIKRASGSVIRNPNYYFNESITWSDVTSGGFSIRYRAVGSIHDVSGMSAFSDDNRKLKLLLGILSTKISDYIFKMLNPTIHLQIGNFRNFPVLDYSEITYIIPMIDSAIDAAKTDWDSFETSWDFKRHPLVPSSREKQEQMLPQFASSRMEKFGRISWHFDIWKQECETRFNQLKSNKEELNRIFIDIYGLQDELTPEVEDKDVTIYRIYDSKEDIPDSMAGSRYALTKQDVIKSFISYAVGCMFGRYSLDTEGLQFAGGEWNSFYSQLATRNSQLSFPPDKDNILPICDDEYFDDDILGRFVDFVRVVYGEETLEENLKFIADALGGKGTPREIIRNYFLNGFYVDHCKTYHKRPIYWLFDSGKKNGFKALFYLHRYSRDLLAKLRTDYVHEQQERYRTQLSHIAVALNSATGAERARLLKQQVKLTEQLKEITAFEEKVHHLADQNIEIDLDDGVNKNYEFFDDVLAKK